MVFSQIYNPDRFNQKADFENLLFAGTDIDFFTEINDKLYLMVEWKCQGAGLPYGQALGFKRLTRDLGQVKPTFLVTAYHHTTTDQSIDGDNSFVGQVFFRLPNMTRMEEFIYSEDESPTLNQWLSDFSYEWRIQKVLKFEKVSLWEGMPRVNMATWDRVSQSVGPSALFDHIRPVRHSFEGLDG